MSTAATDDCWTLRAADRTLLGNKSSATRLGFAVLLKLFQAEGRFPRRPEDVPAIAVEAVARQVGVPAAAWTGYDWRGRTIEYHRAQIRAALGFREATDEDAAALTHWLEGQVLATERRHDRLVAAARERCRSLRIEPPFSERLDRLVRSALHRQEEAFCAALLARLPPETAARLDALLRASDPTPDDGEDAVSGPPALLTLRTGTGQARLQSVSEEADKLRRIRALALPGGLFDGVPSRVMLAYRRRVAAEELHELRRHPDALRLTLLAAFCHVREREIADSLTDLLITTVHRIGTKAEKRVEGELIGDLKRVAGKPALLIDHPPLWWTPRVSSCGGGGAYDDEENPTGVHGRVQARGGGLAAGQRPSLDADCDGAGPGAIGAATLAQPGERGGTGGICSPAWGCCGCDVGRAGGDPPPAPGAGPGADGARHLKKSSRHLLEPAEMRFRFIEGHREVFLVRVMCSVLHVSASGYYAWRGRPMSARAQANQALVEDIRRVHAGIRRRYGSPRVHASLQAEGKRVGCNRVARLMHEHGIQAHRRRPFRKTTDSNHAFPPAPNLLDRQFASAVAPNQVWLADMTYIATGEGWLYLAAILDLFSRKIVGWAMSETMPQELTLAALHMAITNRNPGPGLLHHSDRGSELMLHTPTAGCWTSTGCGAR